ncbi:hypothetical protein CF319_g1146 [Tilletia indica]|nr:hypothetical protein CF319_g1146 [Tilletia indica]
MTRSIDNFDTYLVFVLALYVSYHSVPAKSRALLTPTLQDLLAFLYTVSHQCVLTSIIIIFIAELFRGHRYPTQQLHQDQPLPQEDGVSSMLLPVPQKNFRGHRFQRRQLYQDQPLPQEDGVSSMLLPVPQKNFRGHRFQRRQLYQDQPLPQEDGVSSMPRPPPQNNMGFDRLCRVSNFRSSGRPAIYFRSQPQDRMDIDTDLDVDIEALATPSMPPADPMDIDIEALATPSIPPADPMDIDIEALATPSMTPADPMDIDIEPLAGPEAMWTKANRDRSWSLDSLASLVAPAQVVPTAAPPSRKRAHSSLEEDTSSVFIKEPTRSCSRIIAAHRAAVASRLSHL